MQLAPGPICHKIPEGISGASRQLGAPSMKPIAAFPLVLLVTLVSCGPSEQAIAQAISETQAASAPELPTAPADKPLPPTPTDPPAPTATRRPTSTPGPVALTDDFSRDSGIWGECEVCTYEGGTLHFGPFPTSGARMQHNIVCEACGMVTNYRMGVDVTYIDGPSERGFGLMARWSDEELITYEVTTWQTLDLWRYDNDISQWTWINGTFSGSVRPGKQLNHIELQALTNPSGTVDFSLTVNGRTPIVVFSQPAEVGAVGLTLYGHAIEVAFDNFEFETDDTPVFPSGAPGSSG